MSAGKLILHLAILIVLSIGLSAPWQKVSEPTFLGFLPAPIFYLIIVHIIFVCYIGYLAFSCRLHGKVEDDEKFLAEIRAAKNSQEVSK